MTPGMDARAGLERALARIAARSDVFAWAHLGDADRLRRAASEIGSDAGPLAGFIVGVKDVLDVAGMPTGCGSPIEAGRPPADADAVSVARLRAAGALVIGKTVTAEYAFSRPGPTRNPLDLARTPGGSSSGSAAAVADGQCDAALATQTGGSTIRPAAYCGIVGYKPPVGTVPLDGLRILAPTIDTIGVHARSVAAAARVASVLEARLRSTEAARPPSFVALGFQGFLPEAESGGVEALWSATLARLADAGVRVVRRALPEPFREIDAAHRTLMSAAVARSLGAVATAHGDRLSPDLLAFIQRGHGETEPALARAAGVVARAHEACAEATADGDLLLWAAATGEAPMGIASTGNSILNRPWSLLGYGVSTVPCGRGPAGLPLGLQIIDPRPGAPDLFPAAALIERSLRERETSL